MQGQLRDYCVTATQHSSFISKQGLSVRIRANCPSFVCESLCFGPILELNCLFSVFCFFCFISFVIRYSQKEPHDSMNRAHNVFLYESNKRTKKPFRMDTQPNPWSVTFPEK